MDKASRQRWTVLMAALGLTVGAIFYPTDDGSVSAPQARDTAPARVPVRTKATSSVPVDGAAEVDEESGIDPFEPRGWQAPPPAPPPQVAAKQQAAVEQAAAPAAPPGPPPLPFKFVGSMNDNAEEVVYLGRGEQALLARTGEVLEGTYKVLAINAHQMEFEHLPTGQKQTLVFPTRDN